MSKVTAPLLGFGASGQIGSTQVYATWRGIQYARRFVIPNNPRTGEQTLTRNAFSYLSAIWKLMAADAIAPWSAFATGKQFLDKNAFFSSNLSNLRTSVDNTPLRMSPGALGGPAITSADATGGVGTVTVAGVIPAPPTGWAITKFVAVAVPKGDPQVLTNFNSYTGSDVTAPYSVALAVPAGAYTTSGFAVYTRPDGRLAYSVSLQDTATAT